MTTTEQHEMMPAMQATWILRPIRSHDDEAIAGIIHTVMTEHGCSGDGFAIHDTEVAAMSAHYQTPTGPDAARYYVVTMANQVMGGAGFAKLAGTTTSDAVCELRKMYYLPEARGLRLGHALLELLLDEMHQVGYRRCYLETTSWMHKAQALYQSLGFHEQAGPEGDTGHHGCDRFFSRDL
jgi:putative acetyltransferase